MLNHHFDNKSDFRKSCIQKLQFSSRFAKFQKDISICKKLEILIQKRNVKNVLLYLPLKFEVNVFYLLEKLRKNKHYNVFVPYIINDDFIPVKYRLPIRIKKYGIAQPDFSLLKNKIDLVVVPVVGIDKNFQRVGFGKGMYDRYFGDLKKKPLVVFTQLELCKTDQKLCESHDILADYVITN